MNDLVASLGINNLSKSQVSEMVKDLDQMVEDFRTRPLDTGPYPYVSCDALTMKVREGERVVKTSVLLATGVNAEGYRELLGMQVATSESVASWTGFFRDLKARGLNEVYLVTSDAHLGIQHAIGEVLPNASWQRCRTHFAKNLSGLLPKTQWPTLSAMFQTIFQQPDAQAVWDQAREVVGFCEQKFPHVAHSPRGVPRRAAGFHPRPEGGVDEGVVEQPDRKAQPGDPPAHRRRRDLPQPRRGDSSGWCRVGGAAR
jgi:transposase-like protein